MGDLKQLRVFYGPWFTYCNYRCEYCFRDKKTLNQKLNVERYFQVIEKISQLPYLIDIRFSILGEPFLSQPLMDGICRLTHCDNVEVVNIVSNLSVNEEVICGYLEKMNLEKFSVSVSLHYTQIKDMDHFLNKIDVLRRNKIEFIVGCVAYPPYLEKIKQYKQLFDEKQIPFFVNPYQGLYGRVGRFFHNKILSHLYPDHYNSSEREQIRGLVFSEFEYQYMMKEKQSRGQLCTAGKDFIFIKDNGDIHRCIYDSRSLGNILTGRFNLDDAYQPCMIDYCPCAAMTINLVEFREKYIRAKNFRTYRLRT
jgi:MoaA/NifB/PqqE/SkfB family radical SAM enzyme